MSKKWGFGRRKKRSGTVSAGDGGGAPFSSSSPIPSRARAVTSSPLAHPRSVADHLRASLRLAEANATLKQKNEEFSVTLSVGSTVVSLMVSARSTVYEAKMQCVLAASEDEVDALLVQDAAAYVLKVVGIPHYLTNERLALHRASIVQVCTKTFVTPRFEMILRSDMDTEAPSEASGNSSGNDSSTARDMRQLELAEVLLQKDLDTLIPGLKAYLGIENSSVTAFRRTMTRQRLAYAKEFAAHIEEEDTYMLHPYRHTEPMPTKVPATFTVACHLPVTSSKMVKTVACSSDETVGELRDKCFRKMALADRDAAAGRQPDEFILKVAGFQDFLFNDTKVMEYDYIRRCLSKDQDIHLTLAETESIIAKYPKERVHLFSIVDQVLEHTDSSVADTPQEETAVVSKDKKWRIKLKRVTGLSPAAMDMLVYASVVYYNGTEALKEPMFTKAVKASEDETGSAAFASWEEWIFSPIPTINLPLGVRLCFSVWARRIDRHTGDVVTGVDPKDTLIGWVNMPVFQLDRSLAKGLRTLSMWHDDLDPDGTCSVNVFAAEPIHLYVELENSRKTVKKHVDLEQAKAAASACNPGDEAGLTARVATIVNQDPLYELDANERSLMWLERRSLVSHPKALPKFLLSIPWCNHERVCEAYGFMQLWAPIDGPQALELVSSKFTDPIVRAHGVQYLDQLSDGEILDYLPQLTQALKHEMFHDSPLASLLVNRAFRSRHRIGNALFWHLKAEMHLPRIAERYGLLLETYLRGCGTHRKELLKQAEVVDTLVDVAVRIKDVSNPKRRLTLLQTLLSEMKLPPVFQLSLDPRYEVRGLRVPKCKFMNSKKLPLWLVFENAEEDAQPITIIFKEGDDLRQDQLTIQLLRLMDKLWKQEGLDLRMTTYGCVSNGDELGMIEVVPNAATTGGINREAGGAKSVWKEDTLANWIRAKNPHPGSQEKAFENFTLSCAAYCVATYVLGIGDRHNDNIMCTEHGHLFHIDFGHFLGNFKTWKGIKRERAPFVFTPQYCAVLGGRDSEEFRRFVGICQRAYNIVRKHGDLLITMFYMMLPCGIPELSCSKDIDWLRTTLHRDLNDEEAGEFFESLIFESLDTKSTVFNDYVHLVAKK